MNDQLILETAKCLLANDPAIWEWNGDTVTIDGTVYPLTPWRYHRRLHTIRPLVLKTNVLKKVCNYKSQRLEQDGTDFFRCLHEELDTLEWMLDEKIVSVYAAINENKTLNAILKTESGILCNLTLATTLPQGTAPVVRHEFVGLEGMICDRSINEQIPVEAVYLFGENRTETYTDYDSKMLGLIPKEVMMVDNITQLVYHRPNVTVLNESVKRIQYVTDCVLRSAETGEVVTVEGN